MIIPRTRLLIWFAIIVVPFATLVGLVPGVAAISYAAIALFILTVIIDACLTAGNLRGVSLELPPILRATQERPFLINVRVRNPSQHARSIRIACAFPVELQPGAEEITVDLPAQSEWSAFDWHCTAVKRGKFKIASARLDAASPLGFWSHWKTTPVSSEVRAYPNLARERKN